MQKTDLNREGFAMVTTILVVLVLSVMAVGVVWMATSEKKISFNEGVHIASVFAADAGGEAGINFIRVAESPPQITDFGTMNVRNQGSTNLEGSQTYSYNANYLNKQLKLGWGTDYLDYNYRIGARGTASRNGESGVDVVVSRLFKEGY